MSGRHRGRRCAGRKGKIEERKKENQKNRRTSRHFFGAEGGKSGLHRVRGSLFLRGRARPRLKRSRTIPEWAAGEEDYSAWDRRGFRTWLGPPEHMHRKITLFGFEAKKCPAEMRRPGRIGARLRRGAKGRISSAARSRPSLLQQRSHAPSLPSPRRRDWKRIRAGRENPGGACEHNVSFA